MSIWSNGGHWFNSPLLHWWCKILVHLFHETLPAVISCVITKHSPTKLLQGLLAEEKGENCDTYTQTKQTHQTRSVCTLYMIGTKTLTHMLVGILSNSVSFLSLGTSMITLLDM